MESQSSYTATVELTSETLGALQRLARYRNVSLTEAIEQAIQHDWYLEEERQRGSRVLLQRPDGALTTVTFVTRPTSKSR